MKFTTHSLLSVGLILTLSVFTMSKVDADHHKKGEAHKCDLEYKVKNIDGETVDLDSYEGDVLLVVNVASRCGNTPQYAGLQKMFEKYQAKGFKVLGFPCNQFGRQEPGTGAEIKEFCSSKYSVSFPMFAKVDVNGPNAAPFYKNLTAKEAAPKGKGKVQWNFEKFLIGRDGKVVARFSPFTKPEDAKLVAAVEKALAG